MPKLNAFYAQSGGVTAVVNATACAIIETARKHKERIGGVYAGPIRRFPLLRGAIVMWETLALGLRALVFSSGVQMGDEQEEAQSGTIWVTAMASLVAVAAIFFAGPLLLANLLNDLLDSHLLVIVIEGFIRLGVVVGYVGFVGLLPDIRRIWSRRTA